MRYEGFAVSERGYSHILNDTVCQDSSQYVQDKSCTVAAVADGHGSSQYFRSDRGSRFAAEIACNKVREFMNTVTFPFESPETENRLVMQLIHSIITDWHVAVRNDIIKNPVKKEEMKKVPEKYFDEFSIFSEEYSESYTDDELCRIIQNKNAHIPKVYGTTLIVVGVRENYAIGLHIGDGKCVALYDNGTMDEPVPWDENCHLNRCTSICDRNAAEEFRYHIWQGERMPVAVFSGTDGIDDTFAAMLHPFYRNVALDFIHHDFREMVDEFKKKLSEISKSGSRDDVSVSGVINVPKLRKMETVLKKTAEIESAVSQKKQLTEKVSELKFRLDKLKRISSQYNTGEESNDKSVTYGTKISTLEVELENYNKKLSETEQTIINLQQSIGEKEISEDESSVNGTEELPCDTAENTETETDVPHDEWEED